MREGNCSVANDEHKKLWPGAIEEKLRLAVGRHSETEGTFSGEAYRQERV